MTPLKITSQPKNVSVKAGAKATFSLKTNKSSLKYQWYYKKKGTTSWSLWKGKTARSITVTAENSWNSMLVRCKVTDNSGTSVTSALAKVTIIPKLKITSQPKNVTVKKGAKATFSIKASGLGLKYQWYYKKKGKTSWSLWKGKTTNSFSSKSGSDWNGMQVRCVVTDRSGDKLTSYAVTVKLK